jgi:hypothetical protein
MASEHNRLDSRFSIAGAFWAPDATEMVRTGTLTALEDDITFTTAPEYTRRGPAVPLHSSLLDGSVREKISVLHGFTEQGLCTLCDLVEIDRPGLTHYGLGQSITSIAYRASMCVTGMYLGGSQDECLTSARYTFTGLSDWLPNAATETWDDEQITIKIPFKDRDILDFSLLESRIHVTLKVFSQLTSRMVDAARISKSVVYVEVENPSEQSLVWYLDIGNRLENLFSLLIGTSLALERVFVYRGEDSAHVNAKRHKHVRPFDPRDCVRCAPSQLAKSIAIWLSEPRQFRTVENLALGVVRKGKLFLETQFLSLAQALEGVHRVTERAPVVNRAAFRKVRKKIVALMTQENVDPALAERICTSMSYVNDPTFGSRLTRLCERFSDPLLHRMGIDLEQFVADVVVTRNSYTHAGTGTRRGRRRPPVAGSDIFFLNQKMRSLLRGVLLLHLGIPEEQISDLLVREATRWSKA